MSLEIMKKKQEKILVIFGHILFKTPRFSKIFYGSNSNQSEQSVLKQ